MKIVKAVAPYTHPGNLNFKTSPYEAWVKLGGQTAKAHYPWRAFHKLAFQHVLPTPWKSRNEARLRFVESLSLSFDTFPDYACYEIIPFIWDCWPKYFEQTCEWFAKHDVKTAIFTSAQTADRMQNRFPKMNILTITEGIDTEKYLEGKPLSHRKCNLMEIGSKWRNYFSRLEPQNYDKLCNSPYKGRRMSDSEFLEMLGDSKVTVVLPKCVTEPWIAGDVETLTQRYWECMLSRIVMVGVAPKELTELIGYNPVITFDKEHASDQVWDIIHHIDEYQELVNKNRETALRLASWEPRIELIKQFLMAHNYTI